MKRFIGVFAIAISIVLVVTLTMMREGPQEKTLAANLMEVNVHPVSPQTVTDIIIGYGQISPRWETTLSSEVMGRVLTVSNKFLSGFEFGQNEILATIENSSYEVALREARAALATARRELSEEEQRSKIAASNWSSEGFQSAPSKLVLRKPQLEEARRAVRAANASVKRAGYNLDQTKITLPYDGVIINRNISPGDFLQIGSEIGTVYDRSIYEVVVPLSTSDVKRLSDDTQASKVMLRSRQGDKTWYGVISRIEQVLDQQSRWQNVVLEISETQGLIPGIYVTVEFQGNGYDNVLVIPESYPTSDGYLWYVDARSTLQRFMPEILFRKEGSLFVASPFQAKEMQYFAAGRDIFLPDIKVEPIAPNTTSMAGENG